MTAEEIFRGLPRRIHVGATTWRLVITEAASCEHLEEADGMTVFSEFRIYLSSEMALQRALNVVIHEITHCINWVYGISDESTEEHFTTQHSNGLLEVWMRNPRLLNWQIKTLRRMKKEAAHD